MEQDYRVLQVNGKWKRFTIPQLARAYYEEQQKVVRMSVAVGSLCFMVGVLAGVIIG